MLTDIDFSRAKFEFVLASQAADEIPISIGFRGAQLVIHVQDEDCKP